MDCTPFQPCSPMKPCNLIIQVTSAALLQSYKMAKSSKKNFTKKISKIQQELNYLDKMPGSKVVKECLKNEKKTKRKSLDRKITHDMKAKKCEISQGSHQVMNL